MAHGTTLLPMLGLPELVAADIDERRYPAPVSARRALAVIDMLRVPAAGCVLDVACGRGGLLLDTVALHDCQGLGLAAEDAIAAAARASAEREGLAARVEFSATAATAFTPARRFDAILCVGAATSAFGTLEEAAARCLDWLRVGGVLVLGAPFLRRAPAPGYHAVLGTAAQTLLMRGAAARAFVDAGFELLVTAICSESEWDAHETARYRASLRYSAARPDDAGAAALRERAEAWYQAYWTYGRDTLGYSFHAFRKPRQPLRAIAPARVTT
jgi:cyclopropane fatty-acyl-phospholipid synthase-like methyltransferase